MSCNPYGDGNTSNKIVEITKKFLLENMLQVHKKFYDIKWEWEYYIQVVIFFQIYFFNALIKSGDKICWVITN